MRTLIMPCGLLSIALLAGLAVAEEAIPSGRDPEAIKILKTVDSATKAVTTVRYRARSVPSGVAVDFFAPAEGETIVDGWIGRIPARFLTHLETSKPGSEETVEITGGGNEEIYFLIDHSTRKAYADMDPGVLGSSGQAITGFGMVEFVHDTPFDDELGAETVELLEEAEIAGEPCHHIRVVYSGGQGESTWFFSKNDYLPRKRTRLFSTERGEGAIETTIAELEVDPKLEATMFEFELPEGYEQIDDFAP